MLESVVYDLIGIYQTTDPTASDVLAGRLALTISFPSKSHAFLIHV